MLMARRYPGPRWDLLYGSCDGVEKHAVDLLQAEVQRFLPYVVAVRPSAAEPGGHPEHHRILVGTRESNPLVAELAAKHAVTIPDRPEGCAVACLDSPWTPGRRLLVVAGSDPRGTLYGVVELALRLSHMVEPEKPTIARLREAFDSMPDFSFADHPRVDDRGIWTWGYVIYDYVGFLDRMARLKMNMLTVWNDCPPLNCRDVIGCARARGVRVILGFHWGWGLPDLELTRAGDRETIRKMVLDNYRANYRGLGMDGIYFQTLTEHWYKEKDGMTTAAGACALVNDIARALLEDEPGLSIQFGLHATSIQENYVDLAPLDPRVTIVWEDAGQVPYSYSPVLVDPRVASVGRHRYLTVEETVEYSKKLAVFRPGTGFAMVPKGWTNLDWPNEFEHHGPFILGRRDPAFIQRRLRDRQPLWDRVNAAWVNMCPIAVRFYREILGCRPQRFTATGLVEDGLFEARIQPSVALFAETLWNPWREPGDLLQRSINPFYRRNHP